MKTLTAVSISTLLVAAMTSPLASADINIQRDIQWGLQQKLDQQMTSDYQSLPTTQLEHSNQVADNGNLVSQPASQPLELQELGKTVAATLAKEALDALVETGKAGIDSLQL